MSEIAVEFIDVSKSFPGVLANDRISLQIKSGEIHGLLGENGAGKTTLMNLLYGLYAVDKGSILVREKEVDISEPNDAINLGIGMIHQHFMLVETLTVAENVMLGLEHTKNFLTKISSLLKNISPLDHNKAIEEVEDLSGKYGLKVDPKALISDISVGVQQRVEILKVLKRGANILILDEPTAVLTPQESDDLFNTLNALKRQGNTIIFISHKLEETMKICDRVTVLRRGKLVGTISIEGATPIKLAKMMVGRDVVLHVEKSEVSIGKPVLEVINLVVKDDRKLTAVNEAQFEVNSSEILGIAGVQGNGQTELVEAITGIRKIENGEIKFCGKDITNLNSKKVRELGITHIPEDRRKHGLVMDFTIADNLILGSHYMKPFLQKGFRDEREIEKYATRLIEEFDIRTPSAFTKVRNLSGGNQQKVIVARELSRDFQFVVAAQPTRGLDIGVIEYIHKQLINIKDQGKAVLLVSSELEEIFALSDRIAVIYEGKIVAVGKATEFSEEQLGLLMAGKQLVAMEG
ncbi:MAG: ABC transporter ATP-binding protein [Promethearchaeota archaeon]